MRCPAPATRGTIALGAVLLSLFFTGTSVEAQGYGYAKEEDPLVIGVKQEAFVGTVGFVESDQSVEGAQPECAGLLRPPEDGDDASAHRPIVGGRVAHA